MKKPKAPRSVLVADDQSFVRNLLVRMLQQLGYATRAVSTGREVILALKFVDGALILDQQMGGLTGLEILRSVRAGNTTLPRDFPVLIITGNADMDVVTQASALDVSAVLGKPVSKAQLGDRLTAAMKRRIDLKPQAYYAAVKVPKAASSSSEGGDSMSWTLTGKEGLGKRQSSPGPMARKVHYKNVQPGMTIVENLHGENGSLLLGSGTMLTEDIISRLAERCEGDPELKFLSVVPATDPDSA